MALGRRFVGTGAGPDERVPQSSTLSQRCSEALRGAAGDGVQHPLHLQRVGVQLLVSGDFGTDDRFASGASGDEDSPWVALRRYLPAPPSGATVLQLRLVVHGQPDLEVTVPLTSPVTA